MDVFQTLSNLGVNYLIPKRITSTEREAIATLGDLGLGFGRLGPFGNYLFSPAASKLLMVVLMWLGRLEMMPVLVLFTRSFWEW